MNNMGMERGRKHKEPDNQSSGKAMAKIACETAAAASTFLRGYEYPYHDDSDSDTAYHFSFFLQDGLEDSTQLPARRCSCTACSLCSGIL